MTFATFTPPFAPSPQGTGTAVKSRVNTATFGDGYEQRASDGLNTIYRSGTWNWSALSTANCDAVTAFFTARGGVQSFKYTFPGDVERTYIVPDWSTGYPGGTTRSISASYKEVFDLTGVGGP